MLEALQNPEQLEPVIESCTSTMEALAISETDELREDIASELMLEVFPKEISENWDNLSMETRASLLDEYYCKLGVGLGIETRGVVVCDLQAQCGDSVLGLNDSSGTIYVDISLLETDGQLPELLDTLVHEARHQLQHEAIWNPRAFGDIPDETIAQWDYEFKNYINASIDPMGYWYQGIETDAREFAAAVVDQYTASL